MSEKSFLSELERVHGASGKGTLELRDEAISKLIALLKAAEGAVAGDEHGWLVISDYHEGGLERLETLEGALAALSLEVTR